MVVFFKPKQLFWWSRKQTGRNSSCYSFKIYWQAISVWVNSDCVQGTHTSDTASSCLFLALHSIEWHVPLTIALVHLSSVHTMSTTEDYSAVQAHLLWPKYCVFGWPLFQCLRLLNIFNAIWDALIAADPGQITLYCFDQLPGFFSTFSTPKLRPFPLNGPTQWLSMRNISSSNASIVSLQQLTLPQTLLKCLYCSSCREAHN